MKPEFVTSQQMLRFSLETGNTRTEVQTALTAVKRAASFLCV